jgi:hypothetical protein
MTIIQELEEIIQEEKLEMLYPNREYTSKEMIFSNGYIYGLKTALEMINEHNSRINSNL